MSDSDTAMPQARFKHRTVSSALVEEIRRRILDGTLAAGEQLRQDGLAETFGVSRIPVREALFQLEAEGLVRILPHKGASVSEMSATSVSEAFELRALLEPRLLLASAPHLTTTDFGTLDGLLRDYGAAILTGDVSRWGELNTDLHLLLYSRAGKARTLSIVTGLLKECDRYTRLQLSADHGSLERAEEEHTELVRLCRAGAFEQAGALLQAHIAYVGNALAAMLNRRTSSP